jgi:hypothetical protein
MSVSGVSAHGSAPPPQPAAPKTSTSATAADEQAPDGHYKAKGPKTEQVPEADGHYKALQTASSAATSSSSAVQMAVASLKSGG